MYITFRLHLFVNQVAKVVYYLPGGYYGTLESFTLDGAEEGEAGKWISKNKQTKKLTNTEAIQATHNFYTDL